MKPFYFITTYEFKRLCALADEILMGGKAEDAKLEMDNLIEEIKKKYIQSDRVPFWYGAKADLRGKAVTLEERFFSSCTEMREEQKQVKPKAFYEKIFDIFRQPQKPKRTQAEDYIAYILSIFRNVSLYRGKQLFWKDACRTRRY